MMWVPVYLVASAFGLGCVAFCFWLALRRHGQKLKASPPEPHSLACATTPGDATARGPDENEARGPPDSCCSEKAPVAAPPAAPFGDAPALEPAQIYLLYDETILGGQFDAEIARRRLAAEAKTVTSNTEKLLEARLRQSLAKTTNTPTDKTSLVHHSDRTFDVSYRIDEAEQPGRTTRWGSSVGDVELFAKFRADLLLRMLAAAGFLSRAALFATAAPPEAHYGLVWLANALLAWIERPAASYRVTTYADVIEKIADVIGTRSMGRLALDDLLRDLLKILDPQAEELSTATVAKLLNEVEPDNDLVQAMSDCWCDAVDTGEAESTIARAHQAIKKHVCCALRTAGLNWAEWNLEIRFDACMVAKLLPKEVEVHVQRLGEFFIRNSDMFPPRAMMLGIPKPVLRKGFERIGMLSVARCDGRALDVVVCVKWYKVALQLGLSAWAVERKSTALDRLSSSLPTLAF